MSQEIRVLKCFHCNKFQVDIVKKSPKWQCKVCNIKQTVRNEYFRGSGIQCRAKVQELNMTKGQNNIGFLHDFKKASDSLKDIKFASGKEDVNKAGKSLKDNDENSSIENCPSVPKTDLKSSNKENIVGKKSKWNEYV